MWCLLYHLPPLYHFTLLFSPPLPLCTPIYQVKVCTVQFGEEKVYFLHLITIYLIKQHSVQYFSTLSRWFGQRESLVDKTSHVLLLLHNLPDHKHYYFFMEQKKREAWKHFLKGLSPKQDWMADVEMGRVSFLKDLSGVLKDLVGFFKGLSPKQDWMADVETGRLGHFGWLSTSAEKNIVAAGLGFRQQPNCCLWDCFCRWPGMRCSSCLVGWGQPGRMIIWRRSSRLYIIHHPNSYNTWFLLLLLLLRDQKNGLTHYPTANTLSNS